MRILETTIEGLTKVDIVNSVVQLVINSRLHTETLNPSNFDKPKWVDGRAEFTMHTSKGDIFVSTTALEWQATRETGATLIERTSHSVSVAASYIRNVLGCNTCKN